MSAETKLQKVRAEILARQAATERYGIDTADTAKVVRAVLRQEFPSQTFGVRISRYSGGSSVSVRWTDGPTDDAVRAVVGQYDGSRFDGMIDLGYSVSHWWEDDGTTTLAQTSGHSYNDGPEQSRRTPGAVLVRFFGSVSCQREYSEAFRARLAAMIEEFAGEPFDGNHRYPMQVCREPYEINGQPCWFAKDDHRGEYGSTLVYQLAARGVTP